MPCHFRRSARTIPGYVRIAVARIRTLVASCRIACDPEPWRESNCDIGVLRLGIKRPGAVVRIRQTVVWARRSFSEALSPPGVASRESRLDNRATYDCRLSAIRFEFVEPIPARVGRRTDTTCKMYFSRNRNQRPAKTVHRTFSGGRGGVEIKTEVIEMFFTNIPDSENWKQEQRFLQRQAERAEKEQKRP